MDLSMRAPRTRAALTSAGSGSSLVELIERRLLCTTANVAGSWVGTLSQAPSIVVPLFNYELDLKQSGSTVTGTETIAVPKEPQYYGIFTVQGTVTGSTLNYSDISLIANFPKPGFYWLTKTVSLTVASNQLTMSGEWNNNNGLIKLTREPSITVTPPGNQSSTPGQNKTFSLGSFSVVAVASPYNVDINWGDGSAHTKFSVTAAGTIPSKPHTYASAGVDTVSSVVTDTRSHTSNTATFKVTVAAPSGGISGTVFNDANDDHKMDNGELGLGLWQVYIDKNNDGKYDTGDVLATTNADGNFSFTNIAPGTYTIRIVQRSATTTTTAAAVTVSVVSNKTTTGVVFGERHV
jgi:hypothetical protein